jgi:hypothetical protein
MEDRNEEVRKRLQLKLSHQRERICMEYNHRVQELAFEHKKLVHDNQKEAANEITEHFSNGVIMVVLVAQPGVGKTGCVLEVDYIMATHPDDDIIVEANNIYSHCGMNDLEWNEQYRRNMLPSLSLNVAHRSTIKNFIKPLRELEKGLVSTDEAHIASGKTMTESKTLKEAGILNLEHLSSKNNKLLRVSATPEGILEELKVWEDKAALVILNPGPIYKGFQVMLDEQRIRQAPDLQSELDVSNFLNIFEARYAGYHKRFFPMRGLNADILNHIYTIANRMNWKIIHHDSNETILNIDEIMSTSPDNHTIIVIKEYWRASKRVKRDHIGGTYEKPPKTRNTTVTAQGLTARLCDNYEYTGEWLNPDLRPLLYCDLVAIEQYLVWFNNSCDYGKSKYISNNIKSNNGNVKARHSLMHPTNVDGLEVNHVIDNKVNHRVDSKLFRVYHNEETMRNVIKELGFTTRNFKPNPNGFIEASLFAESGVLELLKVINKVPIGIKSGGGKSGDTISRKVWACYKDTNDVNTLVFVVLLPPSSVSEEKIRLIDMKYPSVIIPEEGNF